MNKRGEQSFYLNKYLFLLIIIILLALAYLISKSYLIPLLSAFVLAYLIKPVYNKLSLKLNKSFSALLCVFILIIIVLLPLALLITALSQQLQSSLEIEGLQSLIKEKLSSLPILSSLNINLDIIKEKLIALFISIAQSSLTSLPHFILAIVITFLATYYILINWDFLAKQIENYLPFKDKKKIISDIGDKTKGIVHGYILIAIIEFFVALIGFYISGVKYFLVFPAIIALFAFLPGLGPALVWIPLTLYYFTFGNYLTALGIVITGLLISIVIENFVYAKLIGSKSKIHPLILLIGVFGGVPLFGIFGFIIGPLILVYTIKLTQEIIHQYSD